MLQDMAVHATQPTAADAQQQILTMYQQLRNDGAEFVNHSSLRAWLHPAEICSLQESGVLGNRASSAISIDACKAARAVLTKEASETALAKAAYCWLLSPITKGSRLADTNNCSATPDNLRLHRSAMSRYAPIASGSSRESHLWRGVLEKRRPIIFIGDSLTRGMADAARCEAFRSSGSLNASGEELITYLPYAAGGAGVDDKTLGTLKRTLPSLAQKGGGVVVASFGHHFNLHYAPSSGFVEAFDVAIRPQYRDKLERLITQLEGYAQMGPHCVAVLSTPAQQHFMTSDGAYNVSVFNSTDGYSYGCRAAPAAEQLAETSPNRWRAQDMMHAVASRAKQVIVVPHHWLSAQWWDAHPGAAGPNNRLVRHRVQRTQKSTTDCTHFCYSPFRYESLWWAIRVAAERAQWTRVLPQRFPAKQGGTGSTD